MKIDVLDHGFVELVDVMGDDQAIVDAARISISGENVKSVQSNEALIRYLMRHWHTTPFEMVEFKFRAAMPMFVARQWVRHRTASINELSARYSELPTTYYVPEPQDIQKQATDNKQGRVLEMMDDAPTWRDDFHGEAVAAFVAYRERLGAGMARELARINLPLSTYTAWIWKANLHNIFNFLRLRLHPHAQKEIRVYAEAIATMVKDKVPVAYAAFEAYRLKSMQLTKFDIQAIQLLHGSVEPLGPEVLEDFFPTKREHSEFLVKWEVLNG